MSFQIICIYEKLTQIVHHLGRSPIVGMLRIAVVCFKPVIQTVVSMIIVLLVFEHPAGGLQDLHTSAALSKVRSAAAFAAQRTGAVAQQRAHVCVNISRTAEYINRLIAIGRAHQCDHAGVCDQSGYKFLLQRQ